MPTFTGRQKGARPRLGVRGKFVTAVGVLVLAVLVVSAVAISGLSTMARQSDTLFTKNMATAQHSADLVAATLTVHKTALYQLASTDSKTADELTNELNVNLMPAVYAAVSELQTDSLNDPGTNAAIMQIQAALRKYLLLHTTYEKVHEVGASADAKSDLADLTDTRLGEVVDLAKALNAEENRQALVNKRAFDTTYQATQKLLAGSVVGALLLGLVVTLSLSRNLLPRIRQYSSFATDVAADRPTVPLVPRSHDELTVLGSALNDMVDQRTTASLEQRWQTEFVETLQVTNGEEEAHELIQRHLARSIEASEVLVLKRNNSANRLEAATQVSLTSALAERLISVDPSACLALRLGRGHRESSDADSLLKCQLCGDRPQLSTCEPLTVSGEVIGSVLVTHEQPIDASARAKIRNTVAQAAPMLANLRNLALAEFRANNDPLTGLPNKRATEDTLKRMVAQANRSIAPFSAIMLDLDHFKQINDRFGHALGDDVLAAVGAAIRSCLRESDFGGRFGGEEFLVLLPDTGTQGALLVAEKIRAAVSALRVTGVDREITASLGVAGLLEHAGSSVGLLREADRAQYAAKAAGRNQTMLATGQAVTAEEMTPTAASVTGPPG